MAGTHIQANRCHAIDGLKLLFIFPIVIHHSHYVHNALHHAYMAVDFFFMISGYLLFRTLQAKPDLSAGGYFISRLQKMYPHYVFSFAVMLLSTSVYKSYAFGFGTLIHAFPEMLMIQNLGIFNGGVNYPCWYMSVLIFACPLVFFLGRRLTRKWFHCLGIVCAAISYGCILLYTRGSMETFAQVGPFYLPFWRGMAGLFTGALLLQLHCIFRPVYTKFRHGFQILELAALIAAIGLMWVPGKVDGLILVMLFVLLLSVGSKDSLFERLFNCTAVHKSIRYEYAIYLNHAFIIGILKKLLFEPFNLPMPVNLTVLLIVLTVYSIITETFVGKMVAFLTKPKK